MTSCLWQPGTWRKFHARQQPVYRNTTHLDHIESKLSSLPPIIGHYEVDSSLDALADVANGKAMILHGGDCVEMFENINLINVSQYAKLMLEISQILKRSLKKNIIIIGRVAGQFAKPRSNDMESRHNVTLPIYRGDIVNSVDFSHEGRQADADRLLDAYHHSLKANQYLKQLKLYKQSKHYISHEALLLNYEQCFTKQHSGQYYNLSAHFLWIGNRTRSIIEAHIEYIRGIKNPIGIKIDANISNTELIALIDILNPYDVPGKLTLILRIGAHRIQQHLPKLIRAIKQHKKPVILMSDPMHGNTIVKSGKKFRNINTILLELDYFIDILKAEDMHFGGVHLEMTNQEIIECIDEDNLTQKHYSNCDPRLNYKQSIRVAYFISQKLKT